MFSVIYIWLFAAIISEKGSDAWWYMKVEDLLPSKYRDKASEYEKGTDTMDVWFDSGIIVIKIV
jgi:isoleucyl-tRNA synthetase